MSSKAQALLAYLAMRPGRRHSRDTLATLLWPNSGDEHARQSLRQALVTLRRALRPHAILLADHREARLEGPGLDVDVVRFEALAGDRSADALERSERGTEARARYILGGIAAKDVDGNGSEAAKHYREALVLAEDLGMRPLVAQCHLGLATLGRQRDTDRACREHLATALAMFDELGMQSWLERAKAGSTGG